MRPSASEREDPTADRSHKAPTPRGGATAHPSSARSSFLDESFAAVEAVGISRPAPLRVILLGARLRRDLRVQDLPAVRTESHRHGRAPVIVVPAALSPCRSASSSWPSRAGRGDIVKCCGLGGQPGPRHGSPLPIGLPSHRGRVGKVQYVRRRLLSFQEVDPSIP